MPKSENKSRAEIAIIAADSDYWQELADALGWTLAGFTNRQRAAYYTPWPDYPPSISISHSLELRAYQRNAIMKAIRGSEMKEPSPHAFNSGGGFGIPDRPCKTCGLPDRNPIHYESPGVPIQKMALT